MAQLNLTFEDVSIRLERMDNDTLLHLDQYVCGEQFRPHLEGIWRRAKGSPAGRNPFDAVMMCKIIILGVRNNASDCAVPEGLKDRLTWRRLRHITGVDETPDEKTIWDDRSRLAESGEMAA